MQRSSTRIKSIALVALLATIGIVAFVRAAGGSEPDHSLTGEGTPTTPAVPGPSGTMQLDDNPPVSDGICSLPGITSDGSTLKLTYSGSLTSSEIIAQQEDPADGTRYASEGLAGGCITVFEETPDGVPTVQLSALRFSSPLGAQSELEYGQNTEGTADGVTLVAGAGSFSMTFSADIAENQVVGEIVSWLVGSTLYGIYVAADNQAATARLGSQVLTQLQDGDVTNPCDDERLAGVCYMP